ncbi:hypothetical protein [Massilia cavernae]|uniref:hypothetical protein n=1 Tax=Massilia cavernae TaxID=2320864 RepID=UPI001C719B53|nr:hypothetical protein [Massilia cavernae]
MEPSHIYATLVIGGGPGGRLQLIPVSHNFPGFDEYQATIVPGLYAVGDVVRGLNQVSVVAGHAAVAATNIHARLPCRYRE